MEVNIRKKLRDFYLDVEFTTEGASLGILGASGSGKSMTLKCIAGIVTPDEGRIVLHGRVLYDSAKGINVKPQKRRVGYLFQDYALFPTFTAYDNIAAGLHRMGAAKKKEIVDSLVRRFHLEGLEKHFPYQLSGGQQQRVALARIIACEPEAILLDEPFSALDSHLRYQIQRETGEILKNYDTTVMVTHSRDEVYELCGEVALIDAGRMLTKKETKQIFTDPESRQAALLTGCKNIVPAKKAGEFEVDIPEWGLRLKTAVPVREGLCAAGIRAHYFFPELSHNYYPVRFTGEIEEPFEHVFTFRYPNQAAESPDLWWRAPKSGDPIQKPAGLGVAPVHVMPLYS